ncbi:hypothetical protein BDK51DRAFT_31352 [Blyttiomyces helicus]|uniref:Uncharacterized protein n=1 Tax=Blyttiomyces helicus TaxID=388810 RepID=A0A4P9W9Z9_9FUNG|nr:hypothetical protein BDK51DRAFT_31352 [Blyttiomyces helicus]|eukprot:RKO88355.1 hypothetical protein BDK51DRAFT_31352 [Blyttiomyces helicus]
MYCPPSWSKTEFLEGTGTYETLKEIAHESNTKIKYNPERHSLELVGENLTRVMEARRQLEKLFAPVIVKAKNPWQRPDRPGQWGQRRDQLPSDMASTDPDRRDDSVSPERRH